MRIQTLLRCLAGLGFLSGTFVLTGCPEDGGRPNGSTCEESTQCSSGLCYDGACLDPSADDDADGLLNGTEAALGTDPFAADSDGDGIDDLTEVGDDPNNPTDTDGDFVLGTNTLHDAVEPANRDTDGDCVFDQFDDESRDVTSEQAAKVCPADGVCGTDADGRSATCVAGVDGQAPLWTCDLSGVTGYDTGPDSACDGDDNDCDGRTDEDFVGDSTTCGAGACTGNGVTTCVDGVVVDSCMTDPAENDATCDGVDDDCDSMTDEDYVATDTTCGTGPCAATGTLACVNGMALDSCDPGVGADVDTTCNQVDDDCDAETDEDYVPEQTTCGQGACAATGVTACGASGIDDSCTAGTATSDDATCNGVDEDCDGVDDEDYLSVSTSCGAGACAGSGVTSCADGQLQDSCNAGTGAMMDADCDGVDDDCDNMTDEDYVPQSTTCGTGACSANGTTRCVMGDEQDSCAPGEPLSTTDATCDGVDDDCSGDPDEDYPATATTCGTGPCSANGVLTCVDGQPDDGCEPGVGAMTDTTCNNIDDDCNSRTDDGYIAPSTTCGVGMCAATGSSVCLEGDTEDTCMPGTPQCGSRMCGSDGCGGVCGRCDPPPAVCVNVACDDGGQCVQSVPGGCYIDGNCYSDGDLNPSNGCQVCRRASAFAWSGVSADVACTDDNNGCTDDFCDGAGACAHLDSPNLTACDDGDDTTFGDMCTGGRCVTFEQRLEPLLGSFSNSYRDSAPGAAGAGVNGKYTVFSAAAGTELRVTRYGSSLNGINQSFGLAGADHAVDRRYVVNGGTLWELVNGDWTSTPDTGSLRAVWEHVGTPVYTYKKVQYHLPSTSLTETFYGLGELGGNDLVIRRCTRSSLCDGGVNCPWSCGDMNASDVFTEDGVDLTFFQDQPVIGATVQNPLSGASERHILRYNTGSQRWYNDTALSQAGSLTFLHAVGAAADERLLGGGFDGLFVTDLNRVVPIAVPNVPASTRYLGATEFRGHAVVLAAFTPGDASAYILLTCPLGSLEDSASWSTVGLFVNTVTNADALSISADDNYLYVLGQARTPASETVRSLWRFEWSDLSSPTFSERFNQRQLPTSWQIVDQCPPAESGWRIASGFLQESSNCFDTDGGAETIEKRGSFIRIQGQTLKRSGTLQVDALAVDDDGYGVQFGIQDDKNYYRVSFDRQRGFARLVLVQDDGFTTLAEDLSFSPPANTWHRIEVQRVGETYTVRLDGQDVFSATDSTFTTGDIGLYSWGMGGEVTGLGFDDVRVRPN